MRSGGRTREVQTRTPDLGTSAPGSMKTSSSSAPASPAWRLQCVWQRPDGGSSWSKRRRGLAAGRRRSPIARPASAWTTGSTCSSAAIARPTHFSTASAPRVARRCSSGSGSRWSERTARVDARLSGAAGRRGISSPACCDGTRSAFADKVAAAKLSRLLLDVQTTRRGGGRRRGLAGADGHRVAGRARPVAPAVRLAVASAGDRRAQSIARRRGRGAVRPRARRAVRTAARRLGDRPAGRAARRALRRAGGARDYRRGAAG